MAVKSLFTNDFVAHYGITTSVVADEYYVDRRLFELEDKAGCPIVPYTEGKVRFVNVPGGLDVFAYERFICSTDSSFQNRRRRCDYLLTSHSTDYVVCLVEITSSTDGLQGLSVSRPDLPGGKIKKIERQLLVSLQTMLDVPAIAANFAARQHKICIGAYRVFRHRSKKQRIKFPNNRYLQIERQETQANGARVSVPALEALGFVYYRISHGGVFRFMNI